MRRRSTTARLCAFMVLFICAALFITGTAVSGTAEQSDNGFDDFFDFFDGDDGDFFDEGGSQSHYERLLNAGKRIELDDEEQYAANLSLSNYSEQYFCLGGVYDHYDVTEKKIAPLVDFAIHWAMINRNSAITWRNDSVWLSAESFYDIIGLRIDYDRQLKPQEGDDYTPEIWNDDYGWLSCGYKNGKFYMSMGDGESYCDFTVVDEAYLTENGEYRFEYTVYALDIDIYWDNGKVPSKYYHLTPAKAARLASKGEIEALYTGTAICTSIYWQKSKRMMYLLEYYKPDITW